MRQRSMKTLYVTIAVMLMAGCAHTRDPHPEPMSHTGDMELSCEQIRVEYATNTQVAAA